MRAKSGEIGMRAIKRASNRLNTRAVPTACGGTDLDCVANIVRRQWLFSSLEATELLPSNIVRNWR